MVMMKPIVSSSYWNVNSMQSMGNDLRMLKMFLSFLMTSLSWCDRNDNKRQAVLQLDQTFFFRPTSCYSYSLRISSFKLVIRILWRIFGFFLVHNLYIESIEAAAFTFSGRWWCKVKTKIVSTYIHDSWFLIYDWFRLVLLSGLFIFHVIIVFVVVFYVSLRFFLKNNFWHTFRFRSRTN